MPRKHAGKRGRQFAALPIARVEGETRVMLVTSRETGRWVLPKGWAEKGLTGPELAAKEAFEEAGLVGEVAARPVGSYHYPKRLPKGHVIDCKVDVFPMRVDRMLDDWPEREQRKREWFTLAQAAMAVEEGELVVLLLRLAAPEA
jgi:8-oxo-dGTP pyrophosphatase MutT (NUDIX family)